MKNVFLQVLYQGTLQKERKVQDHINEKQNSDSTLRLKKHQHSQ